jgi:N6-L-threonylcarbamoyladenine synthase
MNAHKHYGGIVPEIAARSHEAGIAKCYVKALKQAHIKNNQITHIAYTASPGLPGSLHIGKIFAKSIASLLNVPLIPLNHMDGHIFSFAINNAKEVEYPFISLVASGGHTVIYLVEAINKIRVLNETVDDPIGETLDKVGRILNLSYPGGISIDKIYDSKKTNTKMIHHFVPGKSFSFSGIKTHILNLVNQAKMKKQKINKIAIASSLLK